MNHSVSTTAAQRSDDIFDRIRWTQTTFQIEERGYGLNRDARQAAKYAVFVPAKAGIRVCLSTGVRLTGRIIPCCPPRRRHRQPYSEMTDMMRYHRIAKLWAFSSSSDWCRPGGVQEDVQGQPLWERAVSGLVLSDGKTLRITDCSEELFLDRQHLWSSSSALFLSAGAPCVSAAAAPQSVWGDVQPGRSSHLHPAQLHPPHGAGQGSADGHTRCQSS